MLSVIISALILIDRAVLPVPDAVSLDRNQYSPVQLPVQVELISPPGNQMYVEDLWRILLFNSSAEIFSVYLFVTIEMAGSGMLMDATTAVFLLPPGSLIISSAELSPIKTEFYNSGFETSVGRMGGFPDGTYTVTFYVYEQFGGLLGTGGFVKTVQNNTPPELQYPADYSEISEPLPLFTWFPSYPLGTADYTIRIVEILEGQSPESAISANPAWIVAEDIEVEEFIYPVYADGFEPGRNYAWQVEGFCEGNSIGKSEVWTFSFVCQGMVVEESTEIWSIETGNMVQCSPAIALDGSIVCGSSDGFVYSIDPSGSELWRYPAGGPVYSVAAGPDGMLFAAGDFGISCIDPAGFLMWHNGMTGPVKACPLILPSGMLYAGSLDGIFYSIDVFTGEIADTLRTGSRIVLPAVADSDGTVYFASDDRRIYALECDSSGFMEKWTFDGDDSFAGGPVIFGGKLYAAAGKEVFCLGMDGDPIWNYSLPSQVYAGPIISSSGTVYAGTGSGNIYALEGDSGRRTGVMPTGAVITSTPALNVTGSLFVGCDDGYLHCMSPSGFSLWEFETNGAVRSSPVIGIDGTVYFGSDDHWIYAVAGSGAGPMTDGWPQFCRNSSNNGFIPSDGEEQ